MDWVDLGLSREGREGREEVALLIWQKWLDAAREGAKLLYGADATSVYWVTGQNGKNLPLT